MPEECLVCKAPLEYLNADTEAVCALCGKKERTAVRCVNGHYVCDACHTDGIGAAFGVCLRETSRDPITVLEHLMAQPFCHMHGPEHHVLVGMALAAAYANAGGGIETETALTAIAERGRKVPGGACGFWGACGAAVSTGIFLSAVTGATPLSEEGFGLANRMTARALETIGKVGGPRCCKRDSYLAVLAAVDFVREHLGVEMERHVPVCTRSVMNSRCIGGRCPFYGAEGTK